MCGPAPPPRQPSAALAAARASWRCLEMTTLAGATGKVAAEPFAKFAIASHEPLEAMTTRQICAGCSKARKYFCYDCLTPMGDASTVPRVALPCEVHVVKHPQEANSKSTGVHAPVLSDARLFSYSAADTDDAEAHGNQLPDYDPATTVLLFPSATSRSLQDMGPELAVVRTAVIVDCTWSQAAGILSDVRLSALPHVHIASEQTLFWRHQRGKSEEHLATIEAVYFFCRQFHEVLHGSGVDQTRWGPYRGQYDNLLYYYSYQYMQIQRLYAAKAPDLQQEQGFTTLTYGIPPSRIPAATSLLRRHRTVDKNGQAIAGCATDTLTAMGAVSAARLLTHTGACGYNRPCAHQIGM